MPAGYCEEPGAARAVRCPVSNYATGPGIISTRDQDRLQLRSMMTILAQSLATT